MTLSRDMKVDLCWGAFGGLMAVLVCYLFLGCASAVKPVEAEATYLGQQVQCVDKYDTKQEIDWCRDAVKRRWAVAKDGGSHD